MFPRSSQGLPKGPEGGHEVTLLRVPLSGGEHGAWAKSRWLWAYKCQREHKLCPVSGPQFLLLIPSFNQYLLDTCFVPGLKPRASNNDHDCVRIRGDIQTMPRGTCGVQQLPISGAVVTRTADRIGERFLAKVTLGNGTSHTGGASVEAKRRAFQMEGSEGAEAQRQESPVNAKVRRDGPGALVADQELDSIPGEQGRDKAHAPWSRGRKCPPPVGSNLGGVSLGKDNGRKSFSKFCHQPGPPYKLAPSLEGTPVGEQDGPPMDSTVPFAPLAQGACLPEDRGPPPLSR